MKSEENNFKHYAITEKKDFVVINGQPFKIDPQVADLIMQISKERDAFKEKILGSSQTILN